MMTTIIGFTGTRKGCTPAQLKSLEQELRNLLASARVGSIEFHHGDCVGADEQAHKLAYDFGATIMVHPPIDERDRGFTKGATKVLSPKPYLERNKDIVNACTILIACSNSSTERRRSGTWSTVRYALEQGKKVIVVFPNGVVNDKVRSI